MAVLEPSHAPLDKDAANCSRRDAAHSPLVRNPMTCSVAIPESLNIDLRNHLIRDDRQEDLCFALWNPSRGTTRITALISVLLLPRDGDRLVHGNASFLAPYFERAIEEALREGCGIAFLHSHPADGWQDMSDDDIAAEMGLAPRVLSATQLPLVGLTLGRNGMWSARFWEKDASGSYRREWCENVRSVGLRLDVSFADAIFPAPPEIEEQIRTVSAWGYKKQADIARMHVGIVGAGSVGSVVAEALTRTGVSRMSLIDFDVVRRHNLDRLLHSRGLDAYLNRPKIKTLARGLRKSATSHSFRVRQILASVSEEEGFRAALDCDILFSCVDRPLGRSVLNFISLAHLIPVVDGGIRIEVNDDGTMKAADWKILASSPGRRCLECADQYSPAMASLEREGMLDDPEYIKGLPANDPLLRNENVFAFSANVASFEVMQMFQMIVAPMGICDAGEQMYHFVPALFDAPIFETCKETCPYPGLTAKGDNADAKVFSQSIQANAIRQELLDRSWYKRWLDWVGL